jgi:hypothetical protein
MDDTVWYERFADIPRIGYVTPAGVRRPALPTRFLRPEKHRSEWDGKRHEYLTWQTEDGETSASPAHRWPPESDTRDRSPDLILQRLCETLDLPGVASDYHFALLSAYEALASHARRSPELYEEVERLCLLDITLVERVPRVIRDDDPSLPTFRVPAFDILVTLYERNGLLDDALAIAQRANAAGQGGGYIEEIEERVATLRAEDA